MKKFEDQLSRMQSLMTYGMVSESTNKKGSFEYHRLASDGKSYGIFKECSKYYIKSAPAEKENLAEAYDYIGGWNNRKDYEYDSFANAQKQFDLKMMSINEACGAKANAATLNPSKKQDYIVEGTENMRKEIARQRQIMANTMTIIREGSYIGVGDPERVSGNNDEDKPYTEKGEAKLDKDMPKANCKPAAESNPYGDGKAPEKGKDVKSSDVLSNGTAVAAEHPSGGKVTRVDEECSGCVNNSAPNGARDWAHPRATSTRSLNSSASATTCSTAHATPSLLNMTASVPACSQPTTGGFTVPCNGAPSHCSRSTVELSFPAWRMKPVRANTILTALPYGLSSGDAA